MFHCKVNGGTTSCSEVVINPQEFKLLADRPILAGELVPRRETFKETLRALEEKGGFGLVEAETTDHVKLVSDLESDIQRLEIGGPQGTIVNEDGSSDRG